MTKIILCRDAHQRMTSLVQRHLTHRTHRYEKATRSL